MSRPLTLRFLSEHKSSSATHSPNLSTTVNSELVLMVALLCALICVLCWLRRLRVLDNKGLEEKILQSLPKLAVTAESAAEFSDCAICLSELSVGDEIRVLPQCGHGFHLWCIDTWLGSNSSCPWCRQIVVVGTAGAGAGKCFNFKRGGLPSTGTSRMTPPDALESDSEATHNKENGGA